MVLAANKVDLLEATEAEGQKDYINLQTQEGLDEFAHVNGFFCA
jgi:hypothetical protein